MSVNEQYKHKIYDETASLIANLYFREQINEEEMYFLLNILELVIIKKDNPDLVDVLKEWIHSERNSDIDQIIKATLLTIDFKDKDSINSKYEIIKELIRQ